jgi:hypothetical protein
MNFSNSQVSRLIKPKELLIAEFLSFQLLSTDFTNSKEHYLNVRLKEILFANSPVVCR